MEVMLLFKKERKIFEQTNNNSNINKKAIVDRMEINKLTQMVTILERDLLNFQISKNFQKANNPLIPLSQLFSGIFLSIISLLWILQIIFAVLTKPIISPFLNIYLIWFDSWFPMFGNLTYALFSLYLLMCTIIGCFKISMKSFCCKLHPMKINGTYINSFLFNLGIILLCTIPLIHFCVVTFNGYTVDTDVYLLFNIQIKYLHFYTVFYGTNNVFIWMLMLSACAILPYYFVRPLEVANDEDTEEMKKKFLKRRDKENNNNNDNNNNSSFLTRFLSFLFYPLNFLRYFSTSSSSGEKSFNFNNPSRNNKYAPTSSVNMDVEDRIIKENKKKIIVRK
jgi:LMBR1 domain-containing protein 1